MNNLRAFVIFLIITISKSDDPSCLYEFESESEMEDFDSTCDGLKGEWRIEDVPDSIPLPSGHGKQGLTIKQQSNGCLQSSKKLTLNTTTKVICKFYWNKQQSGSVNFKIKFLEDSTNKAVGNEWDIAAIYDNQIGEKWFEASYEFTFPKIQNYKLQIMLYLNSAKVLIDSISILDIVSNSDQCYVRPRTTTTEFVTTTTTELTTTTTELTTTTTEEVPTTTTTSEATTTTEADLTTTTTVKITTMTTTSESTTATTAEYPDLPETSTTTAATSQPPVTTTTDITEEVTHTTTFLEGTTTTSFSSDVPTITSSSTSPGTLPPNTGSNLPDFNLFLIPFIVIVLLTVIVCLCCIGVLLRRRRRKKSSTGLNNASVVFDERQKTDHEFYHEIAEEWKASGKRQCRLKS